MIIDRKNCIIEARLGEFVIRTRKRYFRPVFAIEVHLVGRYWPRSWAFVQFGDTAHWLRRPSCITMLAGYWREQARVSREPVEAGTLKACADELSAARQGSRVPWAWANSSECQVCRSRAGGGVSRGVHAGQDR